MGGEKHQDESSVMELQGSPPRGRGKGPHHKYCHPFHRITPAWAGKSPHQEHPLRQAWDHPRVGGEKGSRPEMDTVRRGSPPRGRGKVVPAVIVIGALGITPAWAGKSALWPRCGRDAEDHPRVGGEKADTLGEVLMEMGSPPRGRGKGENMNAYAEGIGITPAWAGKRLSILGLSKGGEDHPRVGGEKLIVI